MTLLNNGNVLGCSTGCPEHNHSGCGSTTCLLYAPSTNSWSYTGSLSSMDPFLGSYTSTLLPSGMVLVAAGVNGSNVISSAELYTL